MHTDIRKQGVVLCGLQEAAEAAAPEVFEDFDEHDPVEPRTVVTAAAQGGGAAATGGVESNMVSSQKRTARGRLLMQQCVACELSPTAASLITDCLDCSTAGKKQLGTAVEQCARQHAAVIAMIVLSMLGWYKDRHTLYSARCL